MRPALILIVALAGLCWFFPPFHIRSLKAVHEAEKDKQFNATDFASTFWTEQLLPAAEHAADAATVVEQIKSKPESVREKFGRVVGMGDSYCLFLRGDGRVVSADEDSIGLSLEREGDEAQIVIDLGFVFSNAVRDATGLIKPSSYPNAQEFNDISAALNKLVETNVLPRLQQAAKVGGKIHFVGCVEIGDEDMDLTPLNLVPIVVTIE